jgi:hypothetical protein
LPAFSTCSYLLDHKLSRKGPLDQVFRSSNSAQTFVDFYLIFFFARILGTPVRLITYQKGSAGLLSLADLSPVPSARLPDNLNVIIPKNGYLQRTLSSSLVDPAAISEPVVGRYGWPFTCQLQPSPTGASATLATHRKAPKEVQTEENSSCFMVRKKKYNFDEGRAFFFQTSDAER